MWRIYTSLILISIFYLAQFAYTREVAVNADNVERLLPAADQFHVIGLIKACSDFLMAQIEHENCLGIRNFARHYFCHNLERASQRFIMENFQVRDYTTQHVCTQYTDQVALNMLKLGIGF